MSTTFRTLAVAACLALSSTACAGSEQVAPAEMPVPVAEELVPLGQPLRVAQVVITPISVLEDSRCPENARCVWAGRAVVETEIFGPGWKETVPLTLGEGYTTHDMTVMLSTVAPEKTAQAETPAAAYLFGYQVY